MPAGTFPHSVSRFRRTRELAEEHPNLVKAVYRAFCTAKDRMQEQYVKGMTFNNMSIMLPWFSNLIDEDRALLGDDWWPLWHPAQPLGHRCGPALSS
jgi:hypothetical protein